MKRILFFLSLFILIASFATAQSAQQQIKTTSGKTVGWGRMKSYATTDSALNIMDTVAITNNTAGVIEVTVTGVDSIGLGVTGKQIYRYSKTAGTLTLSAATQTLAIVTDTGLGTATYTFTATASNNLKLTVKGKLNRTVTWRSLIKVQ